MKESKDYSLASVHSIESLGRAHFEVLATKEHVNDETNISKESSIPSYLKFTIKELEINQEEFLKVPPLKTEWKEIDNDPHEQKTFQGKATPGTLKRIFGWATTKIGVAGAHYKIL